MKPGQRVIVIPSKTDPWATEGMHGVVDSRTSKGLLESMARRDPRINPEVPYWNVRLQGQQALHGPMEAERLLAYEEPEILGPR